MSQWFPTIDSLLAIPGDVIDDSTETAGDAAGNLLGGAFGGLGTWLLQLVAILAIALVTIKVVA